MALVRGLATLVLLVPLFTAGCIAPRVGAESVTLTFACHDHEVPHYRSLIEVFQAEHPAIVIRLASLDEIARRFPEHPAGEIGRLAAAVDAFVAGEGRVGYNVALRCSAGQANGLAGTPDSDISLDGVLLDLAPYARREGLYPGKDLFAGAVEPFLCGDRLYGLPHQAHAYVLYYDPSAFERAGLPLPRLDWTRDDLLRAAVATTERLGDETLRYGFVDRWPGYTITALAGAGTAGSPTSELDAVALADALLWYADLVRVHHAAPDPSTPDAGENAETLLMGERSPAMWTGHSFEAGRFRRRYSAEVVPLPQGRHPAAPITVSGYMISARTLYPEAAWRWIEFLSRQPSATYYGGIMARRSAAYWEELDATTATTFRYCLEYGAHYGPGVWTPVQSALVGVLRGEPLGEVMGRGPWEPPPEPPQGSSATPTSSASAPTFLDRPPAVTEWLPETGGTESVTIRFGVRSDQDATMYRLSADRLALEQRGIAVEVVANDPRPLADELRPLVADVPADCFVAGAEVARQAPEEKLMPLDRFLPEAHLLRAYPQSLLDPLRGGGHVWGLPLDADVRVLVYNRDRFDAAGLSYPSPAWTAQGLVEHAALLTDVTAEPPLYGYWPRGGAAFRAGEMIAWLGGSLLRDDGWPTLDTPTAVAVMERYADLIASSTPSAGWGAPDGALLWGSYPAPVEGGQVALWLDDYASANLAMGRNPALGIAPLPQGAVMPPPRLERALYISAGAAHPEACWEWLWYLGGRPEAASLLPARLEVAAGDAWRQRVGDEVAEVWQTTLSRLQEKGDPWGPYSDGTTLRWVDRAFVEVLQGADPEEALSRAQAEAEVYAECMRSASGPVRKWEECVGVAEARESTIAGE